MSTTAVQGRECCNLPVGSVVVEAEPQRQQDDAIAEERKQFVREAAIRFALAYRLRDDILFFSQSDALTAWAAARLLWDKKPEDC